MDVPEILGTVAEIVITMAGFMGVIVTFGRTGSQAREAYYRIRWTFALSLAVVVALLSPHFLVGFSDEYAVVFGLPLAFFGFALAFLTFLGFWERRKGRTIRTASKPFLLLLYLATVTVIVALLLSAFDLVIPRRHEMLVLGSVWAICLIAFTFTSSVWQGATSNDA